MVVSLPTMAELMRRYEQSMTEVYKLELHVRQIHAQTKELLKHTPITPRSAGFINGIRELLRQGEELLKLLEEVEKEVENGQNP
jgi:hypothetical protein